MVQRPLVTGISVLGDVLEVASIATVVLDHVVVQGLVEHEVIAIRGKVVVASERSVTLLRS